MRFRVGLVISLLVALLVSLSVSYKMSLLPPKLSSRSLEMGTASTRVVVDTSKSIVLDIRYGSGDFTALTDRAVLLGNVMASAPVREYIARRAGIPADEIRASTPLTPDFPRPRAAEGEQKRTSDLLRPTDEYRLNIQSDPTVPILDVYAQAPTAKAAAELANGAVDGLRDYLDDVGGEQGVRAAEQARLTQLGRARGAVINSGVRLQVLLLTFFFVFALCCAATVFIGRVRHGLAARAGARGIRTAHGMSRPNAIDRVRQTGRLLRSEGAAGVGDARASRARRPRSRPRARDAAGRRARTSSARPRSPQPAGALPARPRRAGEPLTVAWVCVPPGAGSGGHTTMFRMVAALERAGHTCVVYLHDRHGWEIEQHRETIRAGGRGSTPRSATRPTASRTRTRSSPPLGDRVPGARLTGRAASASTSSRTSSRRSTPPAATALLAEATYRFGFHGITAGRWLAQLVRRDYGMAADHFDFGCDLDRYALDRRRGANERTGVCYYCRPSTPRRAHELAVVALDLFAARHPDVDDPPVRRAGRQACRSRHRPRTAHARAAQRALQPLRRRARAVGHERVAGAARDARRRLHPGGQRRRAQPDRARQPGRRVRPPRPRSTSPTRSPSLVERTPAEREPAAARAAAPASTSCSWETAGRAGRARSSATSSGRDRRAASPLRVRSAGSATPCSRPSASSSPAIATRAVLEGCVESVLRPGRRRRAGADHRRPLARRHAARSGMRLAARDARVEVPAPRATTTA